MVEDSRFDAELFSKIANEIYELQLIDKKTNELFIKLMKEENEILVKKL